MGKGWKGPEAKNLWNINYRLVGEVTPITTATHNILGTDFKVTYSNACTITLPLAIDRLGSVSLTNNSVGELTVNCAGTDTIKGDGSLIIAFQYSTAVLYPIRGGWIII